MAVVWALGGYGYLRLRVPPNFPYGVALSIEHGSGNTLYIPGEVLQPTSSVTEGVVWTVSCTQAGCRQTGRRVLTAFGEVFAVNSHGTATGYSRPNGDGSGFDAVWQNGSTRQIDTTPLAINSTGEIAGWRVNPAEPSSLQAVLLRP